MTDTIVILMTNTLVSLLTNTLVSLLTNTLVSLLTNTLVSLLTNTLCEQMLKACFLRGSPPAEGRELSLNPNRSLDHRPGVWLSFFGFPSPFVLLSASCLPLCLGVARYAETKVADNLHGSRTELL